MLITQKEKQVKYPVDYLYIPDTVFISVLQTMLGSCSNVYMMN